MSDVGLAIITPAEAYALRQEAEALLRSIKRWKICECDVPWRGTDGHCGRCGKRVTFHVVIRELQKHVDALEEQVAETSEPVLADTSYLRRRRSLWKRPEVSA